MHKLFLLYMRLIVAALYVTTAVLFSLGSAVDKLWLLLLLPVVSMYPLFWIMLPGAGLTYTMFAMPFAGLLFGIDPAAARRIPVKERFPLFVVPTLGPAFLAVWAMVLYAVTDNPFFSRAIIYLAATVFVNLAPLPDMTLGGHLLRACFPDMKPALKFAVIVFAGIPIIAYAAWTMHTAGLFPLVFLGAFFTPFGQPLSDDHSETAGHRDIVQALGVVAFMLACWGGVMGVVANALR